MFKAIGLIGGLMIGVGTMPYTPGVIGAGLLGIIIGAIADNLTLIGD